MARKDELEDRSRGFDLAWLSEIFPEVYSNFMNASDADISSVDLLSLWCLRCNKLTPKPDQLAPSVEQMNKIALKIIDDWGKGDQVFCNSLKKCLKEMLILRSFLFGDSKIDSVFDAATKLTDIKSCYSVLEIIVKNSLTRSVLHYSDVSFIQLSFEKLAYQDDRSGIVGRFLAAGLAESTPDEWFGYFKPFLHSSVARNNVMTYFLEPILKQQRGDNPSFHKFLQLCQQEHNHGLEISALKAARNANLDVGELAFKSKAVIASLESLDIRERFDALALLCTSTRKLTTPVPPEVYQLIMDKSDSLLAQGEPKARSEVFGSLRHLISRSQHLKDESHPSQAKFREFIEFLHQWSGLNLRAGMPYRCMAMAVKLLELLALTKELRFTALLVRGLVGSIATNFVDIRISAVDLLNTTGCGLENFKLDTQSLYARGFEMVVHTRTSDSGARLLAFLTSMNPEYNLVEQVEHQIMDIYNAATTDLESAAKEKCLHGLLTTYWLLIQNKNFVLANAIKISKTIWQLCSPYTSKRLPNEVSDFCWKAVKEACVLVECIAKEIPDQLVESGEIPSLLETLAQMLTETQHWGVLSTIPLAFIAVGKLNPENALLRASSPINDVHAGKISRSVVRRSAGLPYLVTAALTVEFNPQFVESIFELASKETDSKHTLTLPQVHGLNCLREMFIEANLTKKTVGLIERGLQLALKYFCHQEWSLRNCAAMLFTALNRRIFGPQSAPLPANVFFQKYKSSHGILLKTLAEATEHSSLDSVYPALALLTRLKPSNSEENKYLDAFCEPVLNIISSKNWQVRATAAQAFATMIKPSDKLAAGIDLIRYMELGNKNELHGFAIAAYLLLKQCDPTEVKTELEAVAPKLVHFVHNCNCMEVNIELYKIWTLYSSERLVEFNNLFKPRHLNPSVTTFEALQIRNSQQGELANYSNLIGWLPVFHELKSSQWTVNESLQILKDSSILPEIQVACLKLVEYNSKIYNLAIKLALCEHSPLSVRQESLLYICKTHASHGQTGTDQLSTELIDLLLEFARDDAPLESRMYSVRCIAVLFHSNTPSTLLYALYKLLSDDEEKVRIEAARSTCEILEIPVTSPPACERILLPMIDAKLIAIKLCENLVKDTERAIKGYLHPNDELFIIERESQFRDEVKAVEVQQQNCLPGPQEYEEAKRAQACIDAINPQWDEYFGIQEDPELFLVHKRINAVLMTFSESSN